MRRLLRRRVGAARLSRCIAVAGCGVGGLAAAILLRAQGKRVVVFDKLEQPAPIGSGLILQPVGLAVLEGMGLGVRVRELGAPIERLYGRALPSERVVLDVRYRARGGGAALGLGVHRGALFQLLYEAACAAGVEIESGRDVAAHDDGRLVFVNGARSARFELVVDALGMRSPLARPPKQYLPYGALWASLDWRGAFDSSTLEQRYEAAHKMAGVLPIGRLPGATHAQAAFFWSLKREAFAAWEQAGIARWKQDVLRLWPQTAPLLDQIEAREQLVFAAYAHRTLTSPVARGLAHVGDAWHCASPQLGQGANMALLDALALSRALARQGDLETALGEYERLRLWHIRLYQAASWAFTPAYQSDSAALAWVRDALMAPLSRIPPAPGLLATLVAGEIGAPLRAIRGPKRAETAPGD